MPALRSAVAAPPVEMSSQPSSIRRVAKSPRPVLSETERRAVGISDRDPGLRIYEKRGHFDSARIDDVLNAEHARREQFGRVGGLNGHAPLSHDRAAIVLVVDEMHRNSAFFRAGFDDGLVDSRTIHAFSTESGEQGGVYVHHTSSIFPDYERRNALQIPRQNNEIDPEFAQQLQKLSAVIGGVEARDVDRSGRSANERRRVG